MLSEMLKTLRLKNNLTQKQVAEILNISRTTYSNYEQNAAEPNIETLIRLADHYHITVDSLLEHNVPYLLDKSLLSASQRQLVDKISKLTPEQCGHVDAYIQGLIQK